jgi:hypothetical protein
MLGLLAVAGMASLLLGQPVLGETAVGLTGGTQAPMGATTNHGWRFTANETFTLTDLGLWDDDLDGMDINHPIGIWEYATQTLLTSGLISAGTGDPLLEHFRYTDVPDVVLQAGVDYVIGFATPSANQDKMVYSAPEGLTYNPAITYIEARYGGGDGTLAMPGPTTSTTAYRFGPNFQFVPEPGTMGLMLLGGLALIRGRK